MKVRSDLKWIPSIDLESVNPNCTKRYCYKSLSDIHSDKNYLNKAKDSRSRSCVSLNRVREESAFSILDIINEFAPSHNVECGEDDLYPSKAKSQRWPLSRKSTKLSSSLWSNTNIIINNQQITLNDDTTPNNKEKDHSHESITTMDDLWFAAGKTLELPPTPSKEINHEHKESEHEYDIAIDEEQECKYNDNNNDQCDYNKEAIISNIINNLICIPFDDQPLKLQKDTLQIPPQDMAYGTTTRSSSLGSEAEINDNGENTTNYSSSNVIYPNEPSMSYIIDDVNTPIPPTDTNTNNTSALYEFLFDGVDTDTDDDDFFGTTMIEMNYRKSVPYNVDNVNDKASILPLTTDAGATLADDTDDKGTANEKVEQEQNPKPSTYVACRPLWELTQR